MDVVVTGAAGFIGSNLTDALLAAGHDVLALDDLSSGSAANVDPRARWHQADVADLDAMTEAFAGREVVFHQAAHWSVVCFAETSWATISGGPTTQPRRTPGKKVFDVVAACSTTSGPMLQRLVSAEPSKPSSR